MGLFDIFRCRVEHPQLGPLRRSRGRWRGTVELPHLGTRELYLAGNRSGPDARVVEPAIEFAARYPSLVPEIEERLFEHYEAYREAFEGGGPYAPESCPTIEGPSAVLSHARLVWVQIRLFEDMTIVEVAFETEWDIEHTVGVRFAGWQFLEFNASVVV